MNILKDQRYNLLQEYHETALGSFDLFDFLVRLRISTDDRRDQERYPLLAHERLHYTQIVATRVGFGHLLTLNELMEKLIYVATQTEYKPPYIGYLNPPYEGKDAALFKRINEILNELSVVWQHVEINELPSLKFPISREPDRIIQLDVDNACVRVGGSIAIRAGLHLICENMAKASDTHIRLLEKMQQHGILDAVKRDKNVLPYGPDYLQQFQEQFGVSLEDLVLESISYISERTGLLYDLPVLYALQEGWESPFDSAPLYALLCGWILLFEETWMPDPKNLVLPNQIGRRYLAMLKHGKEVVEHLLPLVPTPGDPDIVKLADLICEYFKMRPFSSSVVKWADYLTGLREDLFRGLPEGSKDKRNLPILWFIEDGIETLKIFSQRPILFLNPFPYFRSDEGEDVFVVGPPTCCVDTWTANNRMEQSRVLYHMQRAILKELLFSNHSFMQVNRNSEISKCIFKHNCIFADEGAKELVNYLMYELIEIRKHFGFQL